VSWPLFVNWHTPEYAGEAARLCASLERFRLPHVMVCEPSLGSWGRNCNHKPAFIRGELTRFHDGTGCRSVCWLDADAELLAAPCALLPANLGAADLAYVQRPLVSGGGLEGQAALIFFRNCTPVMSFLDAWVERCREVYLTADQHHFNALVGSGAFADLSRMILPAEYCVMPEDAAAGAAAAGTVVRQHQASRRLLPLVGAEPPPPFVPDLDGSRRAGEGVRR